VYAQRASLIAFVVVAVWSRATLAGESELKLGQKRVWEKRRQRYRALCCAIIASSFEL
jgi:hypothetical protein